MVLLITGGQYHNYEWRARHWQSLSPVPCKHICLGQADKPDLQPLKQTTATKLANVLLIDICFPDCMNKEVIDCLLNIVVQSRAVVLLHATLHSFKGVESMTWKNLKGVDTTYHGEPGFVRCSTVAPLHPVMNNLPDVWNCPVPEEVYEVTNIYKGTKVLSTLAGPDMLEHPAIWTHQVFNIPVVAISLGHEPATLVHPFFAQVISNTLGFLTEK